MSQIAERVRQDIITAIKTDQLVLPTLPEVALKVREVADDPNSDIEKLANVIGGDAALSARIIRVANSPLLRASRAIEDLKTGNETSPNLSSPASPTAPSSFLCCICPN